MKEKKIKKYLIEYLTEEKDSFYTNKDGVEMMTLQALEDNLNKYLTKKMSFLYLVDHILEIHLYKQYEVKNFKEPKNYLEIEYNLSKLLSFKHKEEIEEIMKMFYSKSSNRDYEYSRFDFIHLYNLSDKIDINFKDEDSKLIGLEKDFMFKLYDYIINMKSNLSKAPEEIEYHKNIWLELTESEVSI